MLVLVEKTTRSNGVFEFLAEGNADCVRNDGFLGLLWEADIDEERLAGGVLSVSREIRGSLDEALTLVASEEGGDVDGVAGGAELGAVAELERGELVDGHVAHDGGGDDVDAFVNAFSTDGLSTEDATLLCGLVDDFEGHELRPLVVRGVVAGLVGDDGDLVLSVGTEALDARFGPTGGGKDIVKRADDRGTEEAGHRMLVLLVEKPF